MLVHYLTCVHNPKIWGGGWSSYHFEQGQTWSCRQMKCSNTLYVLFCIPLHHLLFIHVFSDTGWRIFPFATSCEDCARAIVPTKKSQWGCPYYLLHSLTPGPSLPSCIKRCSKGVRSGRSVGSGLCWAFDQYLRGKHFPPESLSFMAIVKEISDVSRRGKKRRVKFIEVFYRIKSVHPCLTTSFQKFSFSYQYWSVQEYNCYDLCDGKIRHFLIHVIEI